jgi:chromosome partitioning protein
MRFVKPIPESMPKGISVDDRPGSSGDTKKTTGEFYGVRQIKGGIIFTAFFPNASSVKLAGDFNNWKPEKSPLEQLGKKGSWYIRLELKPGTYRYRYVVDGKWQQDPNNQKIEHNPYGEFNSVFVVI